MSALTEPPATTPVAAADASGRFVAAWVDCPQGGDNTDCRVRAAGRSAAGKWSEPQVVQQDDSSNTNGLASLQVGNLIGAAGSNLIGAAGGN